MALRCNVVIYEFQNTVAIINTLALKFSVHWSHKVNRFVMVIVKIKFLINKFYQINKLFFVCMAL